MFRQGAKHNEEEHGKRVIALLLTLVFVYTPGSACVEEPTLEKVIFDTDILTRG